MNELRRLVASLVMLAPLLAAAQPFPSRAIRLVVPYPPGGTADLMARAMQESLQRSLGQPIIIDNKSGAGGVLAAREVIKAPPDGYTLFFSNASIHAITPLVSRTAGFGGIKEFSPVAEVSSAHLQVIIGEHVAATDLRGFIELARTRPKSLSYATAGVGSFGHLSTELLLKRAGIRMTHIPYRGQAAAIKAVMSGEVDLVITTASGTTNDLIANGRLKRIAVTSALPTALAPRVPTVSSVFSGFSAESWFGIVGPAGMPVPVVRKLNEAFNAALATATIEQLFAGFGMEVRTGSPQNLSRLMVQEAERWAPVIRENKIEAE